MEDDDKEPLERIVRGIIEHDRDELRVLLNDVRTLVRNPATTIQDVREYFDRLDRLTSETGPTG